MRQWLERRMNDQAGPKDGAAPELERAVNAGMVGELERPVPAAAEDHAESRREQLEGHLASKVLYAHLRNRMQISYPLTLNLGAHDAAEVELLTEMAVHAARSGGGSGRDDAGEALAPARPNAAHLAKLEEAARRADRPLGALADALRSAGIAPHAYAVAVMVLSRPDAAEQAFLGYLAARLGLRADAVAGINRRYRR